MVKLSSGIYLLMVLATLAALVIPLFKSDLKSMFTFQCQKSDAQRLGYCLLPLLLYCAVTFSAGISPQLSIPLYITGVLVPWIFARFALPAPQRGMLLLLVTFFITQALPSPDTDFSLPLISFLWGLLACKLSETFDPESGSSWNDLLPAMAWLGGVYWIALNPSGADPATQYNLLGGFLAISLAISLLQNISLPFGEKFFLKPLLLSVIAGLAAMILIDNILMATSYSHWAWFLAGGIFLAAVLEKTEESTSSENETPSALTALALIGTGTLVASRLFNTLGWVVLTVSLFSAKRRHQTFLGWAGLFWLTRTLVQGFIQQYNLNVSGINLTHPYVTAALFGGIILGLSLPYLFRIVQNRKLIIASFLGLGALLPLFSNYFLHAEAAGCLYLTLLITALAVSALARGDKSPEAETMRKFLPWLPAFILPGALLANPLLELGNSATREEQIAVLAYSLLILAIFTITLVKLLSRRNPVEISGNQ